MLTPEQFEQWRIRHHRFSRPEGSTARSPTYQDYVDFKERRLRLDQEEGARPVEERVARGQFEGVKPTPIEYRRTEPASPRRRDAEATSEFARLAYGDASTRLPEGDDGGVLGTVGGALEGFFTETIPGFVRAAFPGAGNVGTSVRLGANTYGLPEGGGEGSIARRIGSAGAEGATAGFAGTTLGALGRVPQQITDAYLGVPGFVYMALTDPVGTAKAIPQAIAEDFRHPLRNLGYLILDVAGAAGLARGGARKGPQIARSLARGDVFDAYRVATSPAQTGRRELEHGGEVSRPERVWAPDAFSRRLDTIARSGRAMAHDRAIAAELAYAPDAALRKIAKREVDVPAGLALRSVQTQVSLEQMVRTWEHELGRRKPNGNVVHRRSSRKRLTRRIAEAKEALRRGLVTTGDGRLVVAPKHERLVEIADMQRRLSDETERLQTALGELAPEEAARRVELEHAAWRGEPTREGMTESRALSLDEIRKRKRQVDTELEPLSTRLYEEAVAERFGSAEAMRVEQARMNRQSGRARARQVPLSAQAEQMAQAKLNQVRRLESDDPTVVRVQALLDEQERLGAMMARNAPDPLGVESPTVRAQAEAGLRGELGERGFTAEEIDAGLAWAESHLDLLVRDREKFSRFLGSKVARGDRSRRRDVYDPEGRFESRQHVFASLVTDGLRARDEALGAEGVAPRRDVKVGERPARIDVPEGAGFVSARAERSPVRLGPLSMGMDVLGFPRGLGQQGFTGESVRTASFDPITPRAIAEKGLEARRLQLRFDTWNAALRESVDAGELVRMLDSGEVSARALSHWRAVRLEPGANTLATRQFLDRIFTRDNVFSATLWKAGRNVSRTVEELRDLARDADAANQVGFFDNRRVNVKTVLRRGEPSAVGKVADGVTQAAKFTVLFSKLLGYVNPQLFGQTLMALTAMGLRTPVEMVFRAPRLWQQLSPEERALVQAGRGSGIAHSLDPARGPSETLRRLNQKAADLYGMVIDSPFRTASFFYHARAKGYTTAEQVKHLLAEAADPESPQYRELLEIRDRVDNDFGRFSRLGPLEQEIARWIFFYPWIRASTLYAVRLPAQHPVKVALLAQGGRVSQQRTEELLAEAIIRAVAGTSEQEARETAREIMRRTPGVFPLGEPDEEGSLKVVSPQSVAVLQGPFDALQIIGAFKSGEPAAELLKRGTPSVSLAGAAIGFDTYFGSEYPQDMSIWERLGEEALGYIPYVTMARRLAGDQGKTFSYSPLEAIFQTTLGSQMPRGLNTPGAFEVAARSLEERGGSDASLFSIPMPPPERRRPVGSQVRHAGQRIRNYVDNEIERLWELAETNDVEVAPGEFRRLTPEEVGIGEAALEDWRAWQLALLPARVVPGSFKKSAEDIARQALEWDFRDRTYQQAAGLAAEFFVERIPEAEADVERAYEQFAAKGDYKGFYELTRDRLGELLHWTRARELMRE